MCSVGTQSCPQLSLTPQTRGLLAGNSTSAAASSGTDTSNSNSTTASAAIAIPAQALAGAGMVFSGVAISPGDFTGYSTSLPASLDLQGMSSAFGGISSLTSRSWSFSMGSGGANAAIENTHSTSTLNLLAPTGTMGSASGSSKGGGFAPSTSNHSAAVKEEPASVGGFQGISLLFLSVQLNALFTDSIALFFFLFRARHHGDAEPHQHPEQHLLRGRQQ
jgi:hypothetical protein